MSYETYGQDILPTAWLGPWGVRWCQAFGGIEDALKDALKDATKARMVKLAPTDALPYIGSERLIIQGRKETAEGHRLRLSNAWTLHQEGGTALGVVDSLAVFPKGASSTYAYGQLDGWHWDEDNWWSRYWILFDTPNGFTQEVWGNDGTWGGDSVWGLVDFLPSEVQELRRLAWFWKSGEAVPVAAAIILTGQVWAPDGIFADGGVWGAATKVILRLGNFWGQEAHWGGTDGTWGSAGTWGVKPEGIA